MMSVSKRRNTSRTAASYLIPVLVAVTVSSCASQKHLRKEGPYWYDDDNKNVGKLRTRSASLTWEYIDRSFYQQGLELLNIERNLGKLFGRPRQALNINSFDEVPDCSWFTNRHGLHRMDPTEIQAGRRVTDGPDTSGAWLVFRPKVGGATPGFWIEDRHGDRYILKFDPPGHPEMATAAAAMASCYFHACGYNVPQETIVYWKPDILRIKEGVAFRDSKGNERLFTDMDLQAILDKAHREPDGSIRSLASLALDNVRGPFSYDGRRKDDPNDWCRHEHRRELRGLYVIASLINHYDTKDQNTLDAYEEQEGRRFLRHYLIDFGSDGDSPKPPKKGYANILDLRDVLVSLVTLGFKIWPWENARPYQYASIGYFESEIFEPDKFDPIMPNPAFENMTDRDAYWGAKIVMAFRDDDLRALIKSGQFSNPEAEEYLLRTLVGRRDKIGRHWFGKVNPLDHFTTEYRVGNLKINFEDLAVAYGLEEEQNSRYRYVVRHRGKEIVSDRSIGTTSLELSAVDLDNLASLYRSPESDDDIDSHLFEIRIRTRRGDGKWSKPTVLWLWYDPGNRLFGLVGIEHTD